MSSNTASPSESRRTLSRRQLLATVGTAAAGLAAGCSMIDSASQPEGEGDTIEILIENATENTAQIAVYITDSDGHSLFSRVYELEPGHLDMSGGIETRPTTVRVFTPGGTAATWEYAPKTDLDCEGVDIGVTLTEEQTIESWYGC